MSRTASPGSGTPYGLARVCRVWRTSRATVYRHRCPAPADPVRRRGPSGPMPDAALVEAIRPVLSGSPFHGEGHRKIWARLRMAGVRTSKRRVLRLMREHGLLAPSRVAAPRGPRNHDGTIIPDRVDEMWGTDLTATWTGQGQAAVFIAVDHRSAECVGIHAAARATRFEALEPIRQGVPRHFAAFAKHVARGLSVRPDHGSQYMSGSLPEGTRLPWYREFTRLRASAARQRLRRALHLHPEREPALGPHLRHHRAASPRTDRVPGGLQHDLDHRAPRLPAARRHPSRAASSRGQGRISSNQMSHQPQAIHFSF